MGSRMTPITGGGQDLGQAGVPEAPGTLGAGSATRRSGWLTEPSCRGIQCEDRDHQHGERESSHQVS